MNWKESKKWLKVRYAIVAVGKWKRLAALGLAYDFSADSFSGCFYVLA